MKFRTKPRRCESGGVLLISLFTVLVIGIGLGSYLTLVSAQNGSVMRSLAWAAAVPAMEAGVEEALTHLNNNGLANLGTDGWVQKSDGWFQKCGNLGGGFAYVVRIEPVNPPVIVSTGVVPGPFGPGTIGTTDQAVLGAAVDEQHFLQRAVRVDTVSEGSFFVKGMVAKGEIDLSGNNVQADSFDSGDTAYSTNGKYDPAKRKDNGDIATNSGLVDSLDVGNADVMGHVSTGPGGSVSIGANGTVGDRLWVTSGRTGIQPGHSSADMNVSFPDMTAPFTTGSIPPSRKVDKKFTWDYVLGDGDYYISDLSGTVLVEGTARLYISSGINMNGSDQLVITNGASLEMYVAAPVAKLDGHGVINIDGLAENFAYYGLPTNTELHMSGNSEFAGTIYAPQADFHLGGGGNNTYDFVGASITATVKMNGHFNFHYDEALARLDRGGRGYLPNSWNEMRPDFGLPAASFAGVSLVQY